MNFFAVSVSSCGPSVVGLVEGGQEGGGGGGLRVYRGSVRSVKRDVMNRGISVYLQVRATAGCNKQRLKRMRNIIAYISSTYTYLNQIVHIVTSSKFGNARVHDSDVHKV